MALGLRARQALLLAVGAAYIFILAWFNRQPIPTTRLVHETENTLQLRQTNTTHLGERNQDHHWLEPGKYLTSTTGYKNPGVTDLRYGLLHIRLHTEFKTTRPGEPLAGLLKVYRKRLEFVDGMRNEARWELVFADRLPGPVKLVHFDRTRLRGADSKYSPRRLAVLYYIPRDETISYKTRIYDLERLERTPFFDSAMREVGEDWWHKSRRPVSANEILDITNAAVALHLCPNDGSDFADSVYSSRDFSFCVGPAGQMMQSVDYTLPGTLDVTEFSLRGSTIVYSRLDDIVRFRMLELPTAADGSLAANGPQMVQTLGPEIRELQRDVGHQSHLLLLHSTRPGHSVDVFLARGTTSGDTFFFSFSLIQNSTKAHRWKARSMKRYRLPVHQQFSGLSRDELRIVHDPPLCEQVGLTTALYFKATDIAVAVDTLWFQDTGSSDVLQFQRMRESRLPYVSTLNSPVAVNMTLDESGAMLAMSTVDDELFIFSRVQVPSSKRILDYRRYFRDSALLPLVATEPESSIDVLNEGETDAFQWQLKLTWQPSALTAGVHWDDTFVTPDNPFAVSQRFSVSTHQQSTTTCL
ncbi:hypothetical protein EC988_005269, partial [Linderina pennispora]